MKLKPTSQDEWEVCHGQVKFCSENQWHHNRASSSITAGCSIEECSLSFANIWSSKEIHFIIFHTTEAAKMLFEWPLELYRA